MKKKYKKKKNKNNNLVILKRFTFLKILIVFIFLYLSISLYKVQIEKHDYYSEIVSSKVNRTFLGESAPRGRIYDRNHILIVDNIPVKTIYYKRDGSITTNDELELARKLSNLIDIDISRLTKRNLKEYFLLNNEKIGNEKITNEEYKKLERRELTSDDIWNLKLERVTEDDIKDYDNFEKKAALIYYLMNNGYYYNQKKIKENITEEEYVIVSENLSSLKGFKIDTSWKRYYPYGDVFRTILGGVSSEETGIPKEKLEYYLKKGYSLNDRVGLNYLEYQYEDYLKGTKDKFLIKNGENILIEKGSRGNDLVLTIDIELQKQIEEIIVNEIIKAKSEPYTDYYDHSFVVITEPSTGEILAMAGKQVILENGEYKVYDYTPGIVTSPVVVGSAIKAASHIVGYNTGALKIGEVRDDSCIKIAGTPLKCSYMYHGLINDIEALKYSSNTYQFRTAINVGKGNYIYNGPLKLDESAFNIYRNTFKEFGLGVKTGIDLPIESLGYFGSNTVSGLLLDFSIGQYDTYTTMQLSQYISTIANNGKRIEPHLLKEVYDSKKENLTTLIKKVEPKILGEVNTEEIYMKRVQEGLREVLRYGGTGYGAMSLDFDPAGKTGTSESFLDTDGDSIVDLETISTTFVAYAPFDNPKATFTVVSPDVSHNSDSWSYVNRRISREITKKFFEIYK